MDLAQAKFKQGMQRLVGSVCIITTTSADGGRNGLTATAVCSLSADPPMLLVSLNKDSNTYQAITENKNIAVNVLSEHDSVLAGTFSSKISPDKKFLMGDWAKGVTGAPILKSSVVTFDCKLDWVVEVATHGLLIANVRASIISGSSRQSLLYSEGEYRALSETWPLVQDTDLRALATA